MALLRNTHKFQHRRILHPFYSVSGFFRRVLMRRLRPTGVIVWVFILILIFLAGGIFSASLFRLLCFVLSLALLGLIFLPFRRVKLHISRQLPEYSSVGEPVAIHYKIRNRGRHRIHDVRLWEMAPEKTPGARQFVNAREPGGEKRNLFDRFFSVYTWTWLQNSLLPFRSEPGTVSLDLAAGETGRYSVLLTPLRRGLAPLTQLRALLPDPFGFYQKCSKLTTEPDRLVVLPKRYPLPEISLPGTARFQSGGTMLSGRSGVTGDFVSLRDYQVGDPLRLIHWPTWARIGKPIVKELEDSYFPRHALLLDTCSDESKEDLFEACVSVAASFLSADRNDGSSIEWLFLPQLEQALSARNLDTSSTGNLLTALATVAQAPAETLRSLLPKIHRHSEEISGCLLILCEWTKEGKSLLQSLRALNLSAAAIVVCRERPAAPLAGVHFVRRATLAADLQSLPFQLE